jgi:hypothetical protein
MFSSKCLFSFEWCHYLKYRNKWILSSHYFHKKWDIKRILQVRITGNFELYLSSGVVKNTKEQDVSETGSVSVFRWEMGDTASVGGPLEKANLNHWTLASEYLLCFENTGRWTESKNSVILSVIHHRQNPFETNIACHNHLTALLLISLLI